MYVLVPDEPNLGFIVVAVIFVSATLLGFASHSPGGLGVFDAAMLVGLWQMDREELLAGMLLFRLLYYILPFVISVILLTFREVMVGARHKPLAAAALVPWRLHNVAASRDDVRGVNPIETAAVSAIVAGMPDPAVLLDRAGRVIHLNAAAAQLAPALRKNELAQFALRSPEIITALRESIATSEPRRTTYLDHVPVDRWMELTITPVPVPTTFGGADKCMLMTFHDLTPLRRVEEMRADFVANASHELRTPPAALP